jgi:hypothetical protein
VYQVVVNAAHRLHIDQPGTFVEAIERTMMQVQLAAQAQAGSEAGADTIGHNARRQYV